MQEKQIKQLLKSKAYPEKTKKVNLVQTYISWIFLTNKFAYKIKKPVNYGYLDFTSLAKRRHFCQEELRLNKRLCQDMYLKVLPVTQMGKQIKIGGKGKIIDYALKMKRLSERSLMDRLLIKEKISKKHLDRIAKILANFHKKAQTSNTILRYGSIKTIKKNWQENFSQTKNFINQTISQPVYYFIEKQIFNFISQNKNLFKKRIKENKIRDCHGDVHTGNIFIQNGIYIFDCIEFNRRFRYQDIASDVAFLSMDLDSLKREDLSRYFVKRYLIYSKDRSLRKLLPFYQSYRAYVKGKVLGFSINPSLSKIQKEKIKDQAKEYFSLALKYVFELSKTQPFLLIMCGIIGSGKSYLVSHLLKHIKAFWIRSDVIRKKLFSLSPEKRMIAKFQKGIYSPKITEKVYQKMILKAQEKLKSGEPCVLDATFSKRKYLKQALKLTKKLNLPVMVIECTASDKIIRARLLKRARTKKEISDARISLFREMKKAFEPISLPKKIYLKINTAQSITNSVNQILSQLLIS